MSGLSVKYIDNIKKGNPYFGQNEPNTKNEPTSSEDKHLSNKAKWMIGATALAATVMLGIVGHKNNWWRKAANEASNQAEEVIKMTKEAFEAAGNKLEKGKAKLANGENYTGTITTKTKSGKDMVLEYENGNLKTAQKLDGEDVLYTKSYKHDEDGVVTEVWRSYFDVERNTNGLRRLYMHNPYYIRDNGLIIKNTINGQLVQDAKTGKILYNRGVGYYYSKDGVLKYTRVDKYGDKDLGKIVAYYPNGKPRFKFDGDKTTEFFDENGNTIYKFISSRRDSYKVIYPDRSYRYSLSANEFGLTKRFHFYNANNEPGVNLISDFEPLSKKRYLSATIGPRDNRVAFNKISDSEVYISSAKNLTGYGTYNLITKELKINSDKISEETIRKMISEIETAIESAKQLHREGLGIRNIINRAQTEILKHNEYSTRFWD